MSSTLARYLSIARQFARIGVVRKSQFRVEFLSQVAMDAVWYACHVGVFEVLMRHARTMAGWGADELRVFVAFLFVSDAFWMMWLGRSWQFSRDLKDGNLDPVRVRPASPIFLYFFSQFSLEAVVNMAIASGYMAWALASVSTDDPLTPWLLAPWGIALCWLARVALAVFFSIAEFHLVNSDLSMFAYDLFLGPAERPLDVFTRRIKLFFLYLVPVGFLTHVPASLVLGRIGLLEGLAYSAFLVAFTWTSCKLWRRAFRRYESALS